MAYAASTLSSRVPTDLIACDFWYQKTGGSPAAASSVARTLYSSARKEVGLAKAAGEGLWDLTVPCIQSELSREQTRNIRILGRYGGVAVRYQEGR